MRSERKLPGEKGGWGTNEQISLICFVAHTVNIFEVTDAPPVRKRVPTKVGVEKECPHLLLIPFLVSATTHPPEARV